MKILSTVARRQLFLHAASLGLACACSQAIAQKFPEKPITLYVGFPAGGAADTVARVLADEMGKQLLQPVLVDNKSGASGNIATQAVLENGADGYSVLFAAIHLATNPALAGVKYDPRKDLVMVSQITSAPVVMLASNASALNTPTDVQQAAKKTPGGLKAGSGGIGTSSHLALELFKRSMNLSMLHVPYRGGVPANQDLVSGQIDVMFDLMSGNLKSLIDAGRVKPLAVMQNRPTSALPTVKSAGELGLPSATYIRSWQGIAVKSGTPKPVIDRLHQAAVAAASSTAFRARMQTLGSEVLTSNKPDDFQAHYLRELTRWATLVKAANIAPE